MLGATILNGTIHMRERERERERGMSNLSFGFFARKCARYWYYQHVIWFEKTVYLGIKINQLQSAHDCLLVKAPSRRDCRISFKNEHPTDVYD
jgi:hypothetical protein